MAKPKHKYDSDEFYDEILALAMQGLNDAEIADALNLTPEVFYTMKNGNYAQWSENQNQRRSERINKVLARGRRKITALVRGAYLKAALGGKKLKTKSTTTRKLRVDGVYTDDVEIQTTETETEMPYNVQALATWMYHHDPEWRKVQRKQDTDASDIPTDVKKGIDIDAWIRKEVEQ